jgi:hypothetical protein
MKNNCLICTNENGALLFDIKNVPVFANSVYPSIETAKSASSGNIQLCQCSNCGFVYNKAHDFSLMQYDPNYDNQQKYSQWYIHYLNGLIDLIDSQKLDNKRIVEVGCGKGHFLELLKNRGYEVRGFDPSYEGDNPDIIKDYFTEKYADFDASLVIMRHTLDAVESPLGLLQLIAKANKGKGKVYIESPDFDWAYQNNAITDILYEHTCYFTKDSISGLFKNSVTGNIFGGQYLYCFADLSGLKSNIEHKITNSIYKSGNFDNEIHKYHQIIKKYKQLIVWGAGGKGVSFVNAVDKENKFVPFLIDIYPKKQNTFVGVTGHSILSPEEGLKRNKTLKLPILVSNPNYLEEVRKTINDSTVQLISWE